MYSNNSECGLKAGKSRHNEIKLDAFILQLSHFSLARHLKHKVARTIIFLWYHSHTVSRALFSSLSYYCDHVSVSWLSALHSSALNSCSAVVLQDCHSNRDAV